MNAAVEDARLRRIAEQSLAEHKKQTQLLERIADVLDTMALEQDALHNTLDEVLEIMNGEVDPTTADPLTIPGFPADPLEGFPSIRKDENGTSN